MCDRIYVVYNIPRVLANALQPIQPRALANTLQPLREGRGGIPWTRLFKRNILGVLLTKRLWRTSGDVVVAAATT